MIKLEFSTSRRFVLWHALCESHRPEWLRRASAFIVWKAVWRNAGEYDWAGIHRVTRRVVAAWGFQGVRYKWRDVASRRHEGAT